LRQRLGTARVPAAVAARSVLDGLAGPHVSKRAGAFVALVPAVVPSVLVALVH